MRQIGRFQYYFSIRRQYGIRADYTQRFTEWWNWRILRRKYYGRYTHIITQHMPGNPSTESHTNNAKTTERMLQRQPMEMRTMQENIQ